MTSSVVLPARRRVWRSRILRTISTARMLRGKLNDLEVDRCVDGREQLLDSSEYRIGDHVLRAGIALQNGQVLENDNPRLADLEREIRCGCVQRGATHSALHDALSSPQYLIRCSRLAVQSAVSNHWRSPAAVRDHCRPPGATPVRPPRIEVPHRVAQCWKGRSRVSQSPWRRRRLPDKPNC